MKYLKYFIIYKNKKLNGGIKINKISKINFQINYIIIKKININKKFLIF